MGKNCDHVVGKIEVDDSIEIITESDLTAERYFLIGHLRPLIFALTVGRQYPSTLQN